MMMKIQKAELFRIIRAFFVSFLFMLGFYKVVQDVFDKLDDPAYTPYILAILVAVWNTVEVVKEIRKSSAQSVS